MQVTGDVVLFGISTVVLIPLLIEGFKGLGMPEKWTGWATLILCFLAAIASVLLNLFPDVKGATYITIYTIVSALVLWLVVTGIYAGGRKLLSPSKKPSDDHDNNEADKKNG